MICGAERRRDRVAARMDELLEGLDYAPDGPGGDPDG